MERSGTWQERGAGPGARPGRIVEEEGGRAGAEEERGRGPGERSRRGEQERPGRPGRRGEERRWSARGPGKRGDADSGKGALGSGTSRLCLDPARTMRAAPAAPPPQPRTWGTQAAHGGGAGTGARRACGGSERLDTALGSSRSGGDG